MTNDVSQKIKTLDELSQIIQNLKKEGKAIVHCHGVFDLLHPGHIRHFEAAKREGDILIVTLTRNEFVGKGPGRPVFNQRLRAESIAALQCVDYVAVNEWPTAVKTIKKLEPDVYVKGSEYARREDDLTGKIYEEEEAITSIGGRIHFTDDITFSSTALLNVYFDVYPEEAEEFLREFRRNHSAEDIITRLRDLRKLKVLIIGDTIIDEYHYCTSMGKSLKANIIATRYVREEIFAGGVLAAANHIAGFCEDVHLVTCLSTQDSRGDFIRTHLKPNVRAEFFYREDAPTVVKRRFVEPAFVSKMFEVCFLDDSDLPEHLALEVCHYLERNIEDYDLVVVADFGHGFIERKIVDVLCKKARFLAVNAQTNSANTGFNLITKYPRADYVCIDEPEIRMATHGKYGNLKDLILRVAKQLECNRVAVTRGYLGSVTYTPEEGFFEIPVFSKQVIDTMGAGDAYLSITSPCVAAGNPMEVVGFVGNAVGALAVLIIGNKSSVEPTPLFKFVTALLK